MASQETTKPRDVVNADPISHFPATNAPRARRSKCKQQHTLKLATYNIRSLGNKFSSISEFITDGELDLAVITETWHASQDDVSVRRSIPPGYRIVDAPRAHPPGPPDSSAHRGGGIILFLREHFVVKSFDVIVKPSSFELLTVSLSTPSGPVTIVAIYRPGSTPPDSKFFGDFGDLLETVATYNSQLIITGDLNVHLENPTDPAAMQLRFLLDSFGLVQHVDQPTHTHGGILDVIITRSDCPINSLMVDPPSISDHGPVSCTLPFALPGPPVFTTRLVRGWRKLDRDQFRAALSTSLLCQDDDFYTGMDAASLFQLYEDTLRDLLDSLVPRHSVKSRSNLASPWFDEKCRSVKRNVRRLERCYRQSREAADRLAWVTAIREKHYFFKTKENEYWEHMITEQRSDSKKLWRTVSTVLGKPSSSFSTPPFSPSEFLSFLSSKVETIRSATSDSPPPVFTPTDCNLGSFDLCHPDDVSKIIKASPAKSCDLDPAPTFLIKEYLDIMLPFLTRLCNASIQRDCLPTSQKTAMVTPRLKKSGLDPAAIQNYRPISNLPFMSKVIEKLILAQLSRYLAANNLFPDYQSGFRRHHSTETAILRVLSDIYAAIDRDQVSLLALLDVSAAFDTVDHSILLERLSTSYGLSGMAFTWLESYITGRVQVIHVGGRQSTPATVYFGVPRVQSLDQSCMSFTQPISSSWLSLLAFELISMPTTPSFMDTVVRLLQPSGRPKSYRQLTRSTPGCHQIVSRSTQGRRSSYGLVHGLV